MDTKKIKALAQLKLSTKVKLGALITLIFIQGISLNSFNQHSYAEAPFMFGSSGLDLELNREVLISEPDAAAIAEAMQKKPQLEEAEKKALEREASLKKLVAFLKRQRSPVATEAYAAQIYDLAKANNADYRIIIAIMGVESGFCRAPYKINRENSYNCFGYLNKVKYSDFTAAFNDLVPKISRQYANRFGWNFEALAKAYGQHGWEKTSRDMRYYASSL